MELNFDYTLKLSRESESADAVALRKVENAKAISKALEKLRKQAEGIATKIQCECAVIEAQSIINS